MIVRIIGKINGNNFCAGMCLQMQTKNLPAAIEISDLPYRIISIAPIFKTVFDSKANITVNNIIARCKREGWKMEMFDG